MLGASPVPVLSSTGRLWLEQNLSARPLDPWACLRRAYLQPSSRPKATGDVLWLIAFCQISRVSPPARPSLEAAPPIDGVDRSAHLGVWQTGLVIYVAGIREIRHRGRCRPDGARVTVGITRQIGAPSRERTDDKSRHLLRCGRLTDSRPGRPHRRRTYGRPAPGRCASQSGLAGGDRGGRLVRLPQPPVRPGSCRRRRRRHPGNTHSHTPGHTPPLANRPLSRTRECGHHKPGHRACLDSGLTR